MFGPAQLEAKAQQPKGQWQSTRWPRSAPSSGLNHATDFVDSCHFSLFRRLPVKRFGCLARRLKLRSFERRTTRPE
jgi:hypothetical protein